MLIDFPWVKSTAPEIMRLVKEKSPLGGINKQLQSKAIRLMSTGSHTKKVNTSVTWEHS